MKKIIRNILFILILLKSYGVIQAQNNVITKDSINIYSVNNDKFSAILDSFISYERHYKYFNDSITFNIIILDSNGSSLQIMSGTNIDTLFIKQDDNVDNCGIFYYNSFRFYICGRSIVENKILKREHKKIKVYKMREAINEKIMGEDDRFFPTTWIYFFNNEKFYSTLKNERRDNR